MEYNYMCFCFILFIIIFIVVEYNNQNKNNFVNYTCNNKKPTYKSIYNVKPINSWPLSYTILPEYKNKNKNILNNSPDIDIARRPEIPHMYSSDLFNDILVPFSSVKVNTIL